MQARSDEQIRSDVDAWHRQACVAHRRMLEAIAEVDREDLWMGEGVRDMAHWIVVRCGVSAWKAERWLRAAQALASLPRIAQALEDGVIGIDKVTELTRFATPRTEASLVAWAQGVSCGRIRVRGDTELRRSTDEVRELEETRELDWMMSEDGRSFELWARGAAADGALIAKGLSRLADRLPVLPNEEGAYGLGARHFDALVALASASLAHDPDPGRATLVLHVRPEALQGTAAAELEGGGVVDPPTIQRLACDARVQMVFEDADANALKLGRIRREPSAAMVRQLRWRDRECRFPACGARRFTLAHHIVPWARGGPTDLENLVLICSFHHRLLHEHGWVMKGKGGRERWYRPDGTRYRAGPAPPGGPAPPHDPERLAL